VGWGPKGGPTREGSQVQKNWILLLALVLGTTLTACSNKPKPVYEDLEAMTPLPPRETVSPAETIDELLDFAGLVVVGTLSEPESAGLLYPADTLEPGWAEEQMEQFFVGMDAGEFDPLRKSLADALLTPSASGSARRGIALSSGLPVNESGQPVMPNQHIVEAIATHVATTEPDEDNTRAAELFDFEFTLDPNMVDPVTNYNLSIEQVLLDETDLAIEAGTELPLRIYGHDPAADVSALEGLEYLRFATNLEPGRRYLILLDTYEWETDIFTEVPYAEGAYLLAEEGVTLADGSDVPYAKGISPEAFIRMVAVAIGKRE
jgi:hypothetical protein